ncbi:MAG: cell division protein FtsA [Bacteroidales bacterium]|jgi:cell division protein FtsA|nr:cell division protein FtsA [Bacteroidales bacterium]
MKNSLIAALDVGTTKIAAIVGQKDENNKIKIINFASNPSKGIARGNVENINEVITSIKQTLDQLSKNNLHEFNEVYVGIAGQHIVTRYNSTELFFNSATEISNIHTEKLKENIEKTVSDSDEEIIGSLPILFTIDNQRSVRNPEEIVCESSLKGNFLLIYAKKTKVNSLRQAINNTGLNIKSMFLEPLASAEAVLTAEERKSCVAMIDIGGGTTDLVVCDKNNIVFTSVLPLGGNNITRTIEQKFNISANHAEQLKTNLGINSSKEMTFMLESTHQKYLVKDLSDLIRLKYEEIFATVLFQLENINYLDKVNKLIITGGGSLTINLKQLANYCTNYEIRIAYPIAVAGVNLYEKLNDPKFSTVIGLLSLGNYEEIKAGQIIEQEKKKENLTTKDNEQEKEQKKSKFSFSSLIGKILDDNKND